MYEQMSDGQINLAITKIIYTQGDVIDAWWWRNQTVIITRDLGRKYSLEEFNPCDEWNDAMLIAEMFKPILDFEKSTVHKSGVEVHNKNLRRAICELFLKLEDMK